MKWKHWLRYHSIPHRYFHIIKTLHKLWLLIQLICMCVHLWTPCRESSSNYSIWSENTQKRWLMHHSGARKNSSRCERRRISRTRGTAVSVGQDISILWCTLLSPFILSDTTRWCSILYLIIQYCAVLCYAAPYFNTWYGGTLLYATLNHTAQYCTVFPHSTCSARCHVRKFLKISNALPRLRINNNFATKTALIMSDIHTTSYVL